MQTEFDRIFELARLACEKYANELLDSGQIITELEKYDFRRGFERAFNELNQSKEAV